MPHSLKLPLSQQLDEMVDGIILLNTPDELCWKIFFEGRDCEDMCKLLLFGFTTPLLIFCLLAGYEKEHVREYIKLFPESTLASLFKGYFACMNTSLAADDDEEHSLYVPTDVDPVDTLLVRSCLTQSIFLLIVFRMHILIYLTPSWATVSWGNFTLPKKTMRTP